MKKTVLIAIFLLVVLHQDVWLANRIEPLVFGFVPVGLAYQVAVSIVAAIVWALLVRTSWPIDSEESEFDSSR